MSPAPPFKPYGDHLATTRGTSDQLPCTVSLLTLWCVILSLLRFNKHVLRATVISTFRYYDCDNIIKTNILHSNPSVDDKTIALGCFPLLSKRVQLLQDRAFAPSTAAAFPIELCRKSSSYTVSCDTTVWQILDKVHVYANQTFSRKKIKRSTFLFLKPTPDDVVWH